MSQYVALCVPEIVSFFVLPTGDTMSKSPAVSCGAFTPRRPEVGPVSYIRIVADPS